MKKQIPINTWQDFLTGKTQSTTAPQDILSYLEAGELEVINHDESIRYPYKKADGSWSTSTTPRADETPTDEEE
ncbi:MAG: hypothetical protein KDA65_14845 [Planctomycetaceae bacterium]|nr:hypothetical protein [Planctomycetaceae bacterium]